MKKLLLIIVIILPLLGAAAYCEENDAEDIQNELLGGYASLYEQQLADGAGELIQNSVSPYSGGFSIEEMITRIAKGEIPLDARSVGREIADMFFGKIRAAAKNMLGMLAVMILSAFLSEAVSGFEQGGAFKIASYVCFIAVASIASNVLYSSLAGVVAAVDNLALFMRCIVPVILTALISCGAVVSAAALEPALLAVTEISVSLIKSVFIPLVMIGAGLGVVNALSDNFKTTKLIEFINSAVKHGLSVLLTIFAAFTGLRSIAASGADALTLKLTKFASSNLIPVVGGVLSDSIEAVMRCSAVIKNALGIMGVIVIFFILAQPILEIAAALLMFRLTAAICEPIAGKPMVECVSSMANGIAAAFSMLISVSVMFIIIITVMINISV